MPLHSLFWLAEPAPPPNRHRRHHGPPPQPPATARTCRQPRNLRLISTKTQRQACGAAKFFACGAASREALISHMEALHSEWCFCFSFGGPEAPDRAGGRPLNKRSITLRPGARAKAGWRIAKLAVAYRTRTVVISTYESAIERGLGTVDRRLAVNMRCRSPNGASCMRVAVGHTISPGRRGRALPARYRPPSRRDARPRPPHPLPLVSPGGE